MPRLSFDDVFIPEKEDVLKRIRENERHTKALTIMMISLMLDKGVREFTVNKEQFSERLANEGIGEPVTLSFNGNGDYLTVKM